MRAILFAASSLAILASALIPASAQPAHTQRSLMQRAEELRLQWAAHPVSGAMTEPSVIAGKILTPDINVAAAPGAPRIMLKIDPGNVGFSILAIQLASPNNQQSVSDQVFSPPYPPMPKQESLTIQVSSPFANQGFGFYPVPGAWTVNQMTLIANDGSVVSYSGPQIGALFPSVVINVTNPGKPDVTPPIVGSGKILTPTISLSAPAPYFAANLNVADSNSGVAGVYLTFTPPNGAFGYGASSTILSPVSKGKVVASMLFQPGAPTGTYTISSLEVCDVAANCAYDSTSAEIQAVFGTPAFQVTN